MAKITNIKGDIFKYIDKVKDKNVILPHVCNRNLAFGAGFVLSLSIWNENPRYTYFTEAKKNGLHLGDVQFVDINPSLVVCNMIAQDGFLSEKTPRPLRYDALMRCMEHVKDSFRGSKKEIEIHCPKFGSGLSGGSWPILEALIHDIWVLDDYNVFVYSL